MVVRLRLARHGTRNSPFYHVVAIRDKAARDARPIEKLGEYDPIPRPKPIKKNASSAEGSMSERVLSSGLKDQSVVYEKRIEWNANRIKYWLDVGAQPSKTVARLLDKAGLIPEGKTFKGIYQPPTGLSPSPLQTATRPLPSAILQAAGVNVDQPVSSQDITATAARQGETLEEAVKTDPKQEALKIGIPETSIDQAA